MIIPDANLLLYAYDSRSEVQPQASRWLQQILAGPETVGLSWITISAFLRISTNLSLGRGRISTARATQIVDEWLARRAIQLINPGGSHWPLLKEMLAAGRVQGPTVTDAQLAALTLEYGGVLHTADRDFARFPGLRWTNPLQS